MMNKKTSPLPSEEVAEETIDPEKPVIPPFQYEDVDPYTADHRDYILNQSRVNLMAISQMSDLKANLMLTLSAVMLQFALVKVSDHSLVGPRAHYWVMVVGALLTILFSAYSTLPKAPVRTRMIDEQGELPKGFILLFFTSYIRLSLPDYKKRMNQLLSSPPRTHDAILEELHAHGNYIAKRKYVPLRVAYITFLFTWVAGAIMYALA
jgi:uncharacterized integral membrane protein